MKRYSQAVFTGLLASFFSLSVTGTTLPFYSGFDWHAHAFMIRAIFDQSTYEGNFHVAPSPSIEPLLEVHGAGGSIPAKFEKVIASGALSFLEVSGSAFINVTKGSPFSFVGGSRRGQSLFISSRGDLLLRLGDRGYSHLFQSKAHDLVSKSLKLMTISSKEEDSGCPDEVIISTGHHDVLDINAARHQCFDHKKGTVRCLLPPAGESIDIVLDKTGKVEVTRFIPDEVRGSCQGKHHEGLLAVIREMTSYSGYKADQNPVQQLEVWVVSGASPLGNDGQKGEEVSDEDIVGSSHEEQEHSFSDSEDSGVVSEVSVTDDSNDENVGDVQEVASDQALNLVMNSGREEARENEEKGSSSDLSQSQELSSLDLLADVACSESQGSMEMNQTTCSDAIASRVQSAILPIPHQIEIIHSPPLAHSNSYRRGGGTTGRPMVYHPYPHFRPPVMRFYESGDHSRRQSFGADWNQLPDHWQLPYSQHQGDGLSATGLQPDRSLSLPAWQSISNMPWYHSAPARPDLASSWDHNSQRVSVLATGSASVSSVSGWQESGEWAGPGNSAMTNEEGTQGRGNGERWQRKPGPIARQGRGSRSSFSAEQVSVMENHFAQDQKPDSQKREEIATATGLTLRQVKVWFQNRRQKEKKSSSQVGMADSSVNCDEGRLPSFGCFSPA